MRVLLILGFILLGQIQLSHKAWGQSCKSYFESRQMNKAWVKSVLDAKESLAYKIHLIRQAQVSIDLSYYAFFGDKAGYIVLSELQKAARRGVKIRIIYDEVGSSPLTPFRPHFLHLIQTTPPGSVEIKIINPLFLPSRIWAHIKKVLIGKAGLTDQLLAFHNRSHDKILLVDANTPNMIAMVGGRNIGAMYYEMSNGPLNYLDYEIIVKPHRTNVSTNRELASYYEMLFAHAHTRNLNETLISRIPYFAKKQATKYLEGQMFLKADPWYTHALSRLEKIDFISDDFKLAVIQFVNDLHNLVQDKNIFRIKWFSKGIGSASIIKSLRNSIERAKSKVEIISPYILISSQDIKLLEQWLLAHPDAQLHIYTNSIVSTDIPLASAIFNYRVAPLLLDLKKDPRIGERLKVYIFFKDPQNPSLNSLHAKIVRIDNRDILVTTSNFNARSNHFNSELGFWLKSNSFQLEIDKTLQMVQRGSVELEQMYEVLVQHPKYSPRLEAIMQFLDRKLNLEVLF